MRILHAVEFYRPSVGGAQEVVRQLSERLARRGHEVTVATSAHPGRPPVEDRDGVRVVSFDVAGDAVRGLRGDVDGYRRFVLDGDWDVVMTYAAQQWTTDALLDVADRIPGRAVQAPCGFSGLRRPEWAGYFARLPEALARFDALVLHSETYQDAGFCREHGLAFEVVPNGADEAEFGALPARASARAQFGLRGEEPVLLTVGSHTGQKGHGVAIEALRRLSGPASLLVVGNVPAGPSCLNNCRARRAFVTVATAGRRRVHLVSGARAHALAAYAAADVFVLASNVEASPIVLFEAAAAGLPFVSTAAGNAAEIGAWTGAGTIVATEARADGGVEARAEDVAAAVTDWLADPARRAAAGEEARRTWQEHFTWDRLAQAWERVYRGEPAAALPRRPPRAAGLPAPS